MAKKKARKGYDEILVDLLSNRDFRYWTIFVMLFIGLFINTNAFNPLFFLWMGFGLAKGFRA
jgi:hypothetical protein